MVVNFKVIIIIFYYKIIDKNINCYERVFLSVCNNVILVLV